MEDSALAQQPVRRATIVCFPYAIVRGGESLSDDCEHSLANKDLEYAPFCWSCSQLAMLSFTAYDVRTGQFLWSKKWKDGGRFCSSLGSSWKFQCLLCWIAEINRANSLGMHFKNWETGLSDKQGHCFWFISAGPGCGKSRCLDEFPEILRQAASDLHDGQKLQKRLEKMYTFKVSFENGTKSIGNIPPALSISARMAYQLQESALSWLDFSFSPVVEQMTFDTVIQHLVGICGVAEAADLTVLILIDGLQGAEPIKPILQMICDVINKSDPFVMIACSSTVQVPIRTFLQSSGQPCIILNLPPVSEPSEFEQIYARLPKYEDRLILKILIQDMDGHGRALEYLLNALQSIKSDTFRPDSIMYEVKARLKEVYLGWNPFAQPEHATALLSAIICGHKLLINSAIPGTNLTVDQIVEVGLFRYDPDERKLAVAYIWMLLISDWIPLRELQNLINVEYTQLRDKIVQGNSAALSFQAFEELWCNYRAVRTRCFRDCATVKWSEFHSGASFSKLCDFSFVNKHLSFVRACRQFGTKATSKDLIRLSDGIESTDRRLFLDKVILNKTSASFGDSMVVLELTNGDLCMEGHQCKSYHISKLSGADVKNERQKAVDPTDSFIVVCSGKVDADELSKLPARTAVIDAECFGAYFGPFAGRAFVYWFRGPVNVNLASCLQLELLCPGIGPITAQKIVRNRPFSGPEDFQEKIRPFSLEIMTHFSFE